MLMNLKKFESCPSPLNVTVHLQRASEFLAGARPAVLMSRPERRRASSIRSLPHRKVFMASQSLARQVLSVALDCAPEAVPIVCQPNGKPGILGQGMQFNISHCEDWCAVAWSAESAVGVDVEVLRPVRNMEAIVSNFFPPIAQQAFHSASRQNQTRVFFRWWARIEAALKASGKDLDDSYECLDDVLHEVCDAIPGLALAVAVVGTGPLTITWHLP
jgi:4'-phosphopantetheinyl transferase